MKNSATSQQNTEVKVITASFLKRKIKIVSREKTRVLTVKTNYSRNIRLAKFLLGKTESTLRDNQTLNKLQKEYQPQTKEPNRKKQQQHTDN